MRTEALALLLTAAGLALGGRPAHGDAEPAASAGSRGASTAEELLAAREQVDPAVLTLARRHAEADGLGAVLDDWDGDGRLDLYVANDGLPDQLWMNQGDGSAIGEPLAGNGRAAASGARRRWSDLPANRLYLLPPAR